VYFFIWCSWCIVKCHFAPPVFTNLHAVRTCFKSCHLLGWSTNYLYISQIRFTSVYTKSHKSGPVESRPKFALLAVPPDPDKREVAEATIITGRHYRFVIRINDVVCLIQRHPERRCWWFTSTDWRHTWGYSGRAALMRERWHKTGACIRSATMKTTELYCVAQLCHMDSLRFRTYASC
jgi:hypothetical protein